MRLSKWFQFPVVVLCLVFAVLIALRAAFGQVDIPPDYDPISDGHVDLAFCYIDGEWQAGVIPDDGSDPNHDPAGEPAVGSIIPAEFAPLLLRDQASEDGARRFTPEGNMDSFGNDFGFLGVPGNSPYWVIPSALSPNVVFLGFSFCADNDCGIYLETDPRVPPVEDAWVTFELVSVDYVGASPTPGEFSVYTFDSFGTATEWMVSADGIDDSDVFITLGHRHANMAFSQLGLYTVKFRVSCFEGPGANNKVTSPEISYHFAVGTYWSKVAEAFSPEHWVQDEIIGALADPDGDFIANVIEFVTGLDPNLRDATAYSPATQTGLPTPSYQNVGEFVFSNWTPAAASQVDVKILSSSDGEHWSPLTDGIRTAPIGTDGQRETVFWSGLGTGPQLFRLECTLLSSIPY